MPTDRRLATSIGLDVFAVVLFVAIGRRNHDERSALTGLVATAAPFVIALAVAWTLVRAWRNPSEVRTGLVLWPLTVVVGMAVRRFVFDDGTALPFVIVATVFVGATLVGWRVAARLIEARRPTAMTT